MTVLIKEKSPNSKEIREAQKKNEKLVQQNKDYQKKIHYLQKKQARKDKQLKEVKDAYVAAKNKNKELEKRSIDNQKTHCRT